MARHWSHEELDRITPPGAADARGHAVMRSLDRMIGDQPISDFYVRDADTCPAAALPALVAEYSLEEFITPDLPEAALRRIIRHAWFLHEAKGYDDGVQLGLALLGMSAEISHWHEQEPPGAPNTHRLTVMVDDVLYPDDGGYFADRQIAALQRMNDATKRWSQDTELRIGVASRSAAYRGAFATTHMTATAGTIIAPPPVSAGAAKVAAIPFTNLKAIASMA